MPHLVKENENQAAFESEFFSCDLYCTSVGFLAWVHTKQTFTDAHNMIQQRL